MLVGGLLFVECGCVKDGAYVPFMMFMKEKK
jgi:hypothetical protein